MHITGYLTGLINVGGLTVVTIRGRRHPRRSRTGRWRMGRMTQLYANSGSEVRRLADFFGGRFGHEAQHLRVRWHYDDLHMVVGVELDDPNQRDGGVRCSDSRPFGG